HTRFSRDWSSDVCSSDLLKVKDIPAIILRAALISVAVLLILAAARAFAWVLIIEGVPQRLAETIVSWNLSPIVFLLAVNLFLLKIGRASCRESVEVSVDT